MGRHPGTNRSPSPPLGRLLSFPPHVRRAALLLFACIGSLVIIPSVHFSFPRSPTPSAFASDGRNETFTHFLDARWPRTPAVAPHIWLTISSKEYINEGTASLGVFVERLNVERSAALAREGGGWGKSRETVLVVLCLDDECLQRCENRGLWCYGGYRWTRPEQVQTFRVASRAWR